MKVLVVGGGGREHALAWKIAQSVRVERVYVAPGNAGTAHEPKCENLAVAADDIERLFAFARERAVELTVIGPEAPLVAGIVDQFRAAGLRCFGPTAAGARLEGSKAYAKDFLARHHIPTARYRTFAHSAEAIAFIQTLGAPVVVKADGLAAGKGVVVAGSVEEAENAVHDMLDGRAFGSAGARVVVEEFLAGEEVSFIALLDGEHVLPLATSQDHKRALDGDLGPNTGGMGAYSPAPIVTPAMHARIMSEVMMPTLRGLQAEGERYVGFLYAGLMIAADGTPRVLEFNCRFGDPETQPVLMRLRSDLVELIETALDGALDRVAARWDDRAALGVVMAAGGYPGDYRNGDAIAGLDDGDAEDVKIFHAGTAERDGRVITHGGRVLCVTALGDTVSAAQARAYEVVRRVRFDRAHYRHDIGFRAIERERDHS